MHRFFIDGPAAEAARITGDDVAHIRRVLRMRAGDFLMLCDGCGTDYEAVIEAIGESEIRCLIQRAVPSRAEPRCRVTLFQALPKSGKLETIVQKCTEIGVSDAAIFVSKRCDAKPGDDFTRKLTRLRRVAAEAAKQSGRGRIPSVSGALSVSDIRPSDFDLTLLAYEEERTRSLKAALAPRRGAERIAMIIGPEGGFAPEEAELLAGSGAVPVSLGPRILRTETAGAAMLAQILYEVEP